MPRLLYIYICSLLLVLSAYAPAMAQRYAANVYKKVSDGYVSHFFADSDGFVWVGTGTSVERLHGMGSSVYTFDVGKEPNEYAAFLVKAMAETPRRTFWVANRRGLWCLDHNSHTVQPAFRDKINSPLHALGVSPDGTLYCGGEDGLYIVQGEEVALYQPDAKGYDNVSNAVLSIDAADDKAVWMLMRRGVALYTPQSSAMRPYPCMQLDATDQFTAMLRYGDTLYVGTRSGRMLTFDIRSGKFVTVPVPPLGAAVSALSADGGLLAVATSGTGLWLYALPGMRQVLHVTDDEGRPDRLLSNNLSSVMIRGGDVLLGTAFYLGANVLSNTTLPARVFELGAFSSESLTLRSSLVTDSHAYLGTRSGFYCVDRKTGQTRRYTKGDGLRSELIFSFFDAGQVVYVGTCGGGLSAFEPSTGRIVDTPLTETITSGDVFELVRHSDGSLLVATSNGLYRLDARTQRIDTYNAATSSLPSNYVFGVTAAMDGKLWLATLGGVTLLNLSTNKAKKPTQLADLLPQGNSMGMRKVYVGRNGTLFFLSLNQSQLFVTDSNLHPLTVSDAPLRIINWTQTPDGEYWMGVEQGAMRLTEDLSKCRFVSFAHLSSELTELSAGSAAYQYGGHVWFSTTHGLVEVDPKALTDTRPVRVVDVVVNGESRASYYQIADETILSLSSNECNLLFRLASQDYSVPERQVYEYCLEGHDTAWHEQTGLADVAYYALAPGHYTFKVRRRYDTESMAVVQVSIGRNWAFLVVAGAMVFLALIALWFVYHRRSAELIGESIEQETSSPTTPTVEKEEAVAPEYQCLASALRQYMQSSEPYLNPDLRQSEVAQALNCSPSELSTLFSHYLKVNYYDFVNAYRVEKFRQLVEAGQHHRFSLDTLSSQCGFKSRATFYRVFKKTFGQTPSDYIRQKEE